MPNDADDGDPMELFRPGGALPLNALNYVERVADGEIDGTLSGGALATVVIAPIGGGVSSLLNRAYQKASNKPGIWAAIVKMDVGFTPGQRFNQIDLFRFFFRKIGIPDSQTENLDEHALKELFDSWAMDAWANVSRAVLIFDGLDQIFINAGALGDPLTLINWLHSLRQEAALGRAPYDKLTLFLPLTGRAWSSAHASPYGTQAVRLYLKKFTRHQVVQAYQQFGLRDSDIAIEDTYKLFLGHPHLTQLFLWSRKDGFSHHEAKQLALSTDGAYHAHWERMKSEILYLIGTNYHISQVLATIITRVDGDHYGHWSETQNIIWNSYRTALRTFGFLDGVWAKPEMCEFYRTAASHEVVLAA